MSDDSVEFGGFGPTTPAHPGIKPTAKLRGGATRSTKQRSNGVDEEPGPSQRLTRNTSGRPAKRKKEEILVDSEDDAERNADGGRDSVQGVDVEETRMVAENVIASSDEDEVRVEMEKRLSRHDAKARTRANGQTQAQQKPPSTQQRSQKRVSQTVIKVQGSEDEDVGSEIEVPAPRPRRAGEGVVFAEREEAMGGRGKGQSKRRKDESVMDVDVFGGRDGISSLVDKIGRTGGVVGKGSTSGPADAKDIELAKSKEKINRLENQNKVLTGQMEELCRVRVTEAEALLERSEEQYEARIRALEEVNMALAEQLARKQPLADISKSTVLNFVTRDVVDAEKQQLDQQIAQLKGELDEATRKLSLKEKEIEEMKQAERELRIELKAEIERTSALAKQPPRQPYPTPRSGYTAEDPKHREAIKLYEDLTNIIVLNIRTGSTVPGTKDEWYFNCCYTHTNESDSVKATTRSLSFSLRSYEQVEGEVSTDWIQYLPTSLDKESEEFVRQLEFLNTAFQFERNQLALFLRTLYTTIEGIVKGDEESDGEAQIEDK